MMPNNSKFLAFSRLNFSLRTFFDTLGKEGTPLASSWAEPINWFIEWRSEVSS